MNAQIPTAVVLVSKRCCHGLEVLTESSRKVEAMKSKQTDKVNVLKSPGFWPVAAACVGMLAGLITISRVDAASFGVRVVDEHGRGINDASVCIGTGANAEQFGTFKTAEDGHVMLEDVPAVPLNVIVSKDSYQGVQFFEPVRNWNLVTEVTLLLDGEGPVCEQDLVDTSEDNASLKINSIYANKTGSSYMIESDVAGAPTHYKISSREDLKDAKWKPYNKKITFNGKANGALYFQVKRFTGKSNGWLEARSVVAGIAVN